MLLSFSVENFRSFREEQTLSLVASNKHQDHPEHTSSIPNDENRALPVAVIYGANGAGKSNLIAALSFLQELIIDGTEPKKPIKRRAFLFDRKRPEEPTILQIQYIEDGQVYSFGCEVTNEHIKAEWLSVLQDGKEISVYERKTTEKNEVKIEAGKVLREKGWGNHKKVFALAEVGVLPNQLFLHFVGNGLLERDQGPIVSRAFRWFSDRLTIIPPNSHFTSLAQLVATDNDFTEFVGDFLKKVATGVDKLRVDEAEVEESFLSGLLPDYKKIIEEMQKGETKAIPRPDHTLVLVEKGEGTKVRILSIHSEHLLNDGSRTALPFSEESDGTQRLTHLLPALYAMHRQHGVYVIDEIDRSLHPLLAKGLVRDFLGFCAGKKSQMIFTTHETAFLDLELLRRDEIWFADKKQKDGNTELYSLAEYNVRKDLKIDKAYLEGRFEAVPPIENALPEWVNRIKQELYPRS